MSKNKNKHDYHDTIKQATGTEETAHELLQDDARARKTDRALAYELLAVNCSMGMLGLNEDSANLVQMELASEIMHNFDPENEQDKYLE